MKYGINMGLWSDDFADEKFIPLFQELKEIGFDGVETPVFNPDIDKAKILGKRLDDLGLERTASSAMMADENPISPDAAVRRNGIDKIKRYLDFCQTAGMTHLIGPMYAAIGFFTGTGRTEDEWEYALIGMREAAEHAEKCNVILTLEPLNRFEIYMFNCASDMSKFVREVDHPNCKMMYDTFHAHIEEKNIEAALLECADVLVHMHVSENDRSTPGKGQIRWDETFSALKKIGYDGWLTIEAFGQALPSLAAATKIWRPMFENEVLVAREGLEFIKKGVLNT